jgi:acetoacetate decarboxylase
MAGLVRTDEEVERIRARMATNRFLGIERVSMTYLTDPAVVEHVLPPGLEPTDRPLAQADVMRVEGSNCVGPFEGGALYVQARHGDRVGNYCVTMPMASGPAITWGRELFGEPKKDATVDFDRDGDRIEAAVERHGESVIGIDATMERTASVDPEPRSVFHYKCLPDVTGGGFQFDPRLVAVTLEAEVHEYEVGTGTLSLATTTHDPLGELAVREPLEATYSVTDVASSQEEVTTVDSEAFAPYAFGGGRVDDWLALDDTADASQ